MKSQVVRPKVAGYVINLDRSVGRWEHIKKQAQHMGLSIERVAGVDGTLFDALDRPNYNHKAFVCANGRPMLPQEYGCYLAHLGALEVFLASDATSAVVMEDDVNLQQDLLSRAVAIVEAAPFADVVKLLNHRVVWYRTISRSARGDLIGKCAFGPQGSAACYLVTRRGAEQLLAALKDIRFPFDVALERGWETGVHIYSVKANVLELSEQSQQSQIADRARYRSIKRRGYRKIPTHIFRIVELFRRLRYSLA